MKWKTPHQRRVDWALENIPHLLTMDRAQVGRLVTEAADRTAFWRFFLIFGSAIALAFGSTWFANQFIGSDLPRWQVIGFAGLFGGIASGLGSLIAEALFRAKLRELAEPSYGH